MGHKLGHNFNRSNQVMCIAKKWLRFIKTKYTCKINELAMGSFGNVG